MLDLSKIENLSRFQEEINKVINNHINECKRDESIRSIHELNYMKLINLMESTIPSLTNLPNGLKVIKKYVKLMKESTSLKPMYEFYKLIKKGHTCENSDLFLSEALACTKSNINSETLSADREKLSKIVAESVKLTKLDIETINNVINENCELINSLEFLLENEKKMSNLDDYLNNFSVVSRVLNENIVKDKTDIIVDNTKDVVSELCEHINSETNVWMRKLLEDIAFSQLTSDGEDNLFESYKHKCINTINEIIEKTEDIETISKMKNMSESLENKKYSKENFSFDIVKLAELNNTLKEEL